MSACTPERDFQGRSISIVPTKVQSVAPAVCVETGPDALEIYCSCVTILLQLCNNLIAAV